MPEPQTTARAAHHSRNHHRRLRVSGFSFGFGVQFRVEGYPRRQLKEHRHHLLSPPCP